MLSSVPVPERGTNHRLNTSAGFSTRPTTAKSACQFFSTDRALFCMASRHSSGAPEAATIRAERNNVKPSTLVCGKARSTYPTLSPFGSFSSQHKTTRNRSSIGLALPSRTLRSASTTLLGLGRYSLRKPFHHTTNPAPVAARTPNQNSWDHSFILGLGAGRLSRSAASRTVSPTYSCRDTPPASSSEVSTDHLSYPVEHHRWFPAHAAVRPTSSTTTTPASRYCEAGGNRYSRDAGRVRRECPTVAGLLRAHRMKRRRRRIGQLARVFDVDERKSPKRLRAPGPPGCTRPPHCPPPARASTLRTLTGITLPRPRRAKQRKRGSAFVKLANLYRQAAKERLRLREVGKSISITVLSSAPRRSASRSRRRLRGRSGARPAPSP